MSPNHISQKVGARTSVLVTPLKFKDVEELLGDTGFSQYTPFFLYIEVMNPDSPRCPVIAYPLVETEDGYDLYEGYSLEQGKERLEMGPESYLAENLEDLLMFMINPHFPALRSGPTAAPGASLQKQIPSSGRCPTAARNPDPRDTNHRNSGKPPPRAGSHRP